MDDTPNRIQCNSTEIGGAVFSFTTVSTKKTEVVKF